MAAIARQVLVEAERAFKKADALAEQMEPHLRRLYGNSAIYAYTNDRATPPGDVLLAAALVAGISLDEKLGLGREPDETQRQMIELRNEMARLQGEVASLRERVDGPRHSGAEDDDEALRQELNRRRRAAARRVRSPQSAQQPPAPTPTPSPRRSRSM